MVPINLRLVPWEYYDVCAWQALIGPRPPSGTIGLLGRCSLVRRRGNLRQCPVSALAHLQQAKMSYLLKTMCIINVLQKV